MNWKCSEQVPRVVPGWGCSHCCIYQRAWFQRREYMAGAMDWLYAAISKLADESTKYQAAIFQGCLGGEGREIGVATQTGQWPKQCGYDFKFIRRVLCRESDSDIWEMPVSSTKQERVGAVKVYIAELRHLARTYDFNNTTPDQLVCDKSLVICGLRNESLREHLLQIDRLNL